ncbi:glutamate--cysteine ligase [Gluconobacter japonicus]|uniref:Glutamate--cysteine ligase n=1 Tax=Gluconobacter japonicus TaxID=376620 RepID=A0ABQ5WKC4_GLUJA|nr:glutamate--cysteine ligase [Gluconobacter japonicus]KXV27675.1 glutamate--cysteine ligase [Gluconobacter japonicus]GBR24899.1 glutamate--cysteine ligase [Gluconobacter japonicus NBRC 3271]GLQ60164.1 glutamate--cysteine ligase [Gluconobacter japonicus]
MSNPGTSNSATIENRAQLVEVLERGSKPQSEWKIGTEHEKFGFVLPGQDDGRELLSAPPYEPKGIGALLQKLEGPDWAPIHDGEALIGLAGQNSQKGRSISLEPAGQFELSGAPVVSLQETQAEMQEHFDLIRGPASELGIGFLPFGFQPLWGRDAMPWMPKSRYAIMRNYMPKVGSLGLDMMTRTCTVQVNLDFGSEADMARKMRVSLALQPLATALFANSPFVEGKANGFMSNRARIWTDTDNQRAGQPSLFFAEDFSFEKYVDWALDVPMYFVARDGKNIDVSGCSFLRWLNGEAQPGLEGLTPTIGDFEDHLTTVFPDVRLKQFLEMRGADAGKPEMMVAQSALWVGLLYDPATLEAAEKLVLEQPWEVYQQLRADVPAKGMQAEFPGGLKALAKRVLTLAEQGLRARVRNEAHFLDPLHLIAEGGPNQAEYWLALYEGAWGGSVKPLFREASI